MVSLQAHVCLLLAIGAAVELVRMLFSRGGDEEESGELPNKGVALLNLNIVQALDRILDLMLVGPHIHNENKCVVLLNLLHCRLRDQRVLDDARKKSEIFQANRRARVHSRVLVKLSGSRDRLARVLGLTGKRESLGATEMNRSPPLAGLGVTTLLDCEGSFHGLGLGGGNFLLCCAVLVRARESKRMKASEYAQ